MICKNCGAELPDGTLICSRCGARQSAGGNGGSGNGGGKKSSGGSSGGRNLGKILAAVLGVCVVVGVSIFFTSKNTQAQDSMFTDNINFDKNALTVINENTLRLRDLPNNQVFSVSGLNGFVDVNVVDENQLKVNYEVKKDKNNYLIAPNGQWDNKHTYTLTVSGDTHFTDEALFRFNKIIFTIHKEETIVYKYNDNIKDLVSNPDEKIEVGDIVIIKDENNQSVCKKVTSIDGNNSYEQVDLAEIFEELEVSGQSTIDFSSYLKDPNYQKQIMRNFVDSPLFEAFIMKTYAKKLSDNPDFYLFEWGDDGEGGLGNIGEKGFFDPEQWLSSLDFTIKSGDKKVGQFNIKFTPSIESDKTEFKLEIYEEYENGAINKDNGCVFTYIIKAPIITYDISKTSAQFDVYVDQKHELDIDFKIKREGKNQDIDNMESELPPVTHQLATFKVPTSVPFLFVYYKLSFEPEAKISGEFSAGLHIKSIARCGTTFIPGEGFIGDKSINTINSGEDSVSLKAKGKLNVEFPIKNEFGVVFGVDPDDIKGVTGTANSIKSFKEWEKKIALAAFLDAYIKIGPKLSVEVSGTLDFPLDFNKYDGIIKYFHDNGTLKAKDTGLGVAIEAGLELKIKFLGIEAKPSLKIFENTFYIVYFGGELKASKSEVSYLMPITEENTTFTIDGQEFLVLKKDAAVGEALIITTDGVDCVPYNKPFLFFGNSKTWKSSHLRKYLNSNYKNNLPKLINVSLSQHIIKTENEDESSYDYVFVLSRKEFLERVPDNYRSIKASALAKRNGAYVATEDDPANHRKSGYTIYWLRDAFLNDSTNAMAINSDGTVYDGNDSDKLLSQKLPKNQEDICVRPAMYVKYTDDYCGYDLAAIGITNKNVNPYINPSVKFEQSSK